MWYFNILSVNISENLKKNQFLKNYLLVKKSCLILTKKIFHPTQDLDLNRQFLFVFLLDQLVL